MPTCLLSTHRRTHVGHGRRSPLQHHTSSRACSRPFEPLRMCYPLVSTCGLPSAGCARQARPPSGAMVSCATAARSSLRVAVGRLVAGKWLHRRLARFELALMSKVVLLVRVLVGWSASRSGGVLSPISVPRSPMHWRGFMHVSLNVCGWEHSFLFPGRQAYRTLPIFSSGTLSFTYLLQQGQHGNGRPCRRIRRRL